jgi:N-acetylmuramoyl-L-alanine amidase
MGVRHLGTPRPAAARLWKWLLPVLLVASALPGPDAMGASPKSHRTAGGSAYASAASSSSPRLWTVRDVRHWSDPAATRVVIAVDGEVAYRTGRLQNPDRLYVDLLGAQLAPKLQGLSLDVADRVLKSIRAAQNQADVVRVVLDLKAAEDYRVFTLSEPYRLVVDIKGRPGQAWPPPPMETAAPPQQSASAKAHPAAPPKPAVAPPGQRWHVVLDAGHGGKDPGAIGASGLMEKDVVLDIVYRLRELMQQEPYWRVTLTREGDVFIPLEERTAVANAKNADLFVSIHANAAERPDLHGIETYFLDLATDDRAKRTAARENATSLKQVSDLELILRDLLMTSKRNESSLLAGTVQRALVQAPGSGQNGRDLGVKQAPFLVLIGAEMPAILIETGFMSNPAEERKLADAKHRARLARTILAGIKEYIAAVNGGLVRQVAR